MKIITIKIKISKKSNRSIEYSVQNSISEEVFSEFIGLIDFPK